MRIGMLVNYFEYHGARAQPGVVDHVWATGEFVDVTLAAGGLFCRVPFGPGVGQRRYCTERRVEEQDEAPAPAADSPIWPQQDADPPTTRQDPEPEFTSGGGGDFGGAGGGDTFD